MFSFFLCFLGTRDVISCGSRVLSNRITRISFTFLQTKTRKKKKKEKEKQKTIDIKN